MKKRFLGVTAICAGVLMVTATSCGSSKQVSATDLAGEWNIVTVNGENIDIENTPYLGLDVDGKRVYGNAGCNRVMGGLELDSLNPGKLHFTQVAATRMMCPDMEVENKVLGAMDKVAGYAENEAGLALTDAEGNTVMVLSKREAPAVSVADLEGEWIIATVKGAPVEKLDKTPFLAFNVAEMRVHGNAGCNIVNGGFSQEEGKAGSLKFGQMMSTMMAGPGMETEQQVLEALNQVVAFGLNEDKSELSLQDEAGTVVLTLTKNSGEKLSE